MGQRKGRLHVRVTQVRKILLELLRRKHAFVGDCSRRQGINEEWHIASDVFTVSQPMSHDASREVKFAFEFQPAFTRLRAVYEHLLHNGLTFGRSFAEDAAVYRHPSPGQNYEAFLGEYFLNCLFFATAVIVIFGKIDKTSSIITVGRQIY